MYALKVFTPEFKALVDARIPKADSIKQTMDNIQTRSLFNHAWNGDEGSMALLVKYYPELATPQFTEIQAAPAEYGYQNRPRILWNGSVQKIDDIDEIFSYKTI